MEVLSYVKDLLLDYANKKAELKSNGESKDKYEVIDKEFVSNMMVLRDRFPEYLFVNYDKDITEEEAKEVFKKIKVNVLNRYSIPFFPKPQFMSINIDGTKMEIPGIIANCLEYKGALYINYTSKDEKRNCINQFLVHLLVSMPIRKITLTFVDLKEDYDSELFLRHLPPSIYHCKPITTEQELEIMLDGLQKRKREVITRYGDITKYSYQNKSIPEPYEIIVVYDDLHFYETKVVKRINEIIRDSSRIGVYFVFSRFNGTNRLSTSTEINPHNDLFFDENRKVLSINSIDANKYKYIDFGYTGLFFEKNEIPGICVKDGFGEYQVYEVSDNSAPSLLTTCQTEELAYRYINQYCKIHNYPTCVKYAPPIEFFFADAAIFSSKCALEIHIVNDGKNPFFEEDLSFYFSQLGFDEKLQSRFLGLLNGTLTSNNSKEKLFYGGFVKGLSNSEPKFPITLWLKYWPTFPSYDESKMFVKKLLSQIDKKAIEKWGKYYKYKHIHFKEDDYEWDYKFSDKHLIVQKNKQIVIPIEHFEIPKNNGIINFTPITSNETLLKACFDYIRTEAEAKEEMKVQTLDFGSAAESKYETDLLTMIIPVGKAESKDADFRMDLVSHVHSFIIGQSGSGKSVFLHNIIGGAMLKYAPEDLQLYLLDFKLGGVEFNRYKGTKHVKALLVDNSDPQVTLEILRELRGSMTERGKLLRNACVNNIGEYNKLHQEDRMPHVLVVADECHEMFKDDESIPRQVRNEISDIVIKIAKEGRSQGVHLVFATQTLSGTEISSEIINNVSDFYLLKCAQTDSERLVPNSSAITSELSTGQIYYHHVDEQVKFQAYYTDKEAAEKLMAAIVEKAKDHKSNGEFYFNGAQMFYLDDSVKEQMLAVKGKSPVAFMGKAIDISQKDLYIKLNEDFSENVLLLGLNDQEQVTRTTMNLFVSLMMSAKLKHKDIAFKVIDCLNNEEGEVHEILYDLENAGYCDIIERRQRSKLFKDLAASVQDGTAEETILLILGQDRFRELKMDMELEDTGAKTTEDNDNMMLLSDNLFGDDSSSSSNVRTYKDALNVILEKGPDFGVHTLLQLEKATNLLFEDYITPKVVFQKFKHLVMLRSDETAGVTLHLNDDIRLEKLSSDWERLRAYYYAEESDSYTLFTPYMPSKAKDIINLLKTI